MCWRTWYKDDDTWKERERRAGCQYRDHFKVFSVWEVVRAKGKPRKDTMKCRRRYASTGVRAVRINEATSELDMLRLSVNPVYLRNFVFGADGRLRQDGGRRI